MMTKKNPNPVDKHVGGRVRMRRLMLGMSQGKLADAIGLTFQQVQKYEKGTNRMGSSRLQQIANILQVPVTFLFQGTPGQTKMDGKAQSPAFVSNFLATSDGLALTKAFMQIKDAKLRRGIVNIVKEIASDA
jgi:transcriptional regulator with XRE-family HTH domain